MLSLILIFHSIHNNINYFVIVFKCSTAGPDLSPKWACLERQFPAPISQELFNTDTIIYIGR